MCSSDLFPSHDTDDVSISTGNPVLDGFFASLMSFLKNLSHRLDDLTV